MTVRYEVQLTMKNESSYVEEFKERDSAFKYYLYHVSESRNTVEIFRVEGGNKISI